ncbi:hypothetical protein LPB140_02900 [Sphingorhabdus lutea]|uniref:Thymidylate kinase n=1 Tax=Sphingorhabdus lutea TaxID=1913578 RepID=A0A1L3J9Y6_9SPHN|nr:hypothetical protein [Sphingorhabdus lutea]APG61946.1 hypothetical protein LPB140_02900 [Sphingorhabdus lutea]
MAQENASDLAPLIAVVGCDGSGKSTLSADLLSWIQAQRPAQSTYLGLRSGVMGNKIKAWPIIGPSFEKLLSKKAKQARTKGAKIPGVATALVIYIFSKIRARRFAKMIALRKSGMLVVTDRYPQLEVPGFYDGPGLSAARAEGAMVSWLSKNELAIYTEMASYIPNLVIRLNIDVKTAFARKPDHKIESLKAKVAATPQLTFNNAPIVDLSSLEPYDQMLAKAKAAVMAHIDGLTP